MSVPDIWGTASVLAKLALYVGVVGAMGLVLVRATFGELVAPLHRWMRGQAVGLAGLAVLAAGLGFMLRGAALTGGVDGMTDPEMLGLLWTSPVGEVLVYRLAGAAMIIVGLFTPRIGLGIALAGGTLALWSFAQIGHVPEMQQTGVRLLLFMHLLGISFWVGVLAPLRALSRQGEFIANAALLGHRFGQAAAVIVPALLVAGVIMAWLILGDLAALVTTGYGFTLLAKLAMVAVVLGMAAANKLRFVPAMAAGDSGAARHLARSIEVETVVLVVVLAATAVLTSVVTLPM